MKTKLFSQLAVSVALVFTGDGQAAQYLFTDLGTLPGGSRSSASAINANGQVVGSSNLTSASGPDSGPSRATLWTGTAVIDLGTLPSANGSYATGINASGQVVGSAFRVGGVTATLWNGAAVIDLGTLPGGSNSNATGINGSGQVVGVASSGSYATLWSGSTITALGMLLNGYSSSAYAINDNGQIVGSTILESSTDPILSLYNPRHATLWNGTTTIDLGTLPGGRYSSANDINASGQVVGSSNLTNALGPVSGHSHATLWTGTAVIDLGTLPGGKNSGARGINASGLIVGGSEFNYTGGLFSNDSHATLWSGAAVIDLNSFLPDSYKNAGWSLRTASDINDSGQIVGDAYNSRTNTSRAYLLTPVSVPEPATYSMIGLGVCLLGAVARRRKQIG